MNVKPETYNEATATAEEVGALFAARITGKVEVDFFGETITAYCRKDDDGRISVYGFTGRYKTGAKAWNVVCTFYPCHHVMKRPVTSAYFGRDEKAGRCDKRSVSYNPKGFFGM